MNTTRLAVAATCLTLTGCAAMSLPKSVSELRDRSASSMLVTETRYQVNRPVADVGHALQTLASKCLNTTTTAQQQYRSSLSGGHSITFITRYETTVRPTEGGYELAMRMIPVRGAMNESKDGGIIFAALASGSNTASDVVHYHGKFHKELSQVVASWAQGRGRACPQMPR